MSSPRPSFNEDVGDSRSLGNVRILEWKHLQAKCKELQMEGCVWHYMRRLATTNAAQFIVLIELLMGVHITLLLIMVRNVCFNPLAPYLLVMILTPLVMWVCLKDNLKNDHKRNVVASWVMAFLLTIMDNSVDISHGGYDPLMVCYDHIVLVAIYFYLPVAFLEKGRPYILGMAVSFVYFICSYWRVANKKAVMFPTLLCYAMYLLFQNIIMTFYFTLRVFGVRRIILTRHQLIYESIVLKVVMKNEKALLESIMPAKVAHTLEEDICMRIEEERQGKRYQNYGSKLFVEPHPDVSILVADMVNYTSLTNTLDVRSLVEILHELFVNYDRAAKRNNALRIKFLGDAYNCVSGIPAYNPDHASCCVDQALDMISITQGVREQRKLNIDMRVGVHSGEVFAGVIGHIKWQYDIWSKDVDITNRLEACGEPGKVHISRHTLGLLNNEYIYEEGTERAKKDPVLQKAEITTYLVSSRHPDFMEPDDLRSTESAVSLNSYRMSFSNIYEDVAKMTHQDMVNQVKHMPIGQRIHLNRAPRGDAENLSEDEVFNSQISCGLMHFHSASRECAFMKMPDLLMKYNLVIVLVAALVVTAMNIAVPFSTLFVELSAMLLVLVLICLIAGFKKLWMQVHALTPLRQPSFFLNRWLIRMSEHIEQQSIYVGIPLYIFVILLVFTISMTGVLVCNRAEFEFELIESDLADEDPQMMCFLPWVVTHSVIIVLSLLLFCGALALSFKMCLGLLILTCYLFIVQAHYGFAFERSDTTNMNLNAEWAHTWYLVAYFITLSIKQRHTTYIYKAIFFIRERYEQKHKQTEDATKSIKIIMVNMLPSHVADNFLERRHHDQLFYENFKNVAVMFASIENYEADRAGIRVLHEFICYFDELLVNFGRKYKIEKIKVMGWTYMAACGLEVEHYTDFSINIPLKKENTSGSIKTLNSVRFGSAESSAIPTPRRTIGSHLLTEDDEAVMVMTEFAVNLLRIMNDIQVEDIFYEFDLPKSSRGCLKIGIAHGPVMAGVVGLSKPHYDIWGSTVNMASRMTSTGLQGAIQVTEATAQVLRRFNIRCSYRGQSWLKGMGNYPTYLVDLTDRLEFQYNDETSSDTEQTKSNGDNAEEQEEKENAKRRQGENMGSDWEA